MGSWGLGNVFVRREREKERERSPVHDTMVGQRSPMHDKQRESGRRTNKEKKINRVIARSYSFLLPKKSSGYIHKLSRF